MVYETQFLSTHCSVCSAGIWSCTVNSGDCIVARAAYVVVQNLDGVGHAFHSRSTVSVSLMRLLLKLHPPYAALLRIERSKSQQLSNSITSASQVSLALVYVRSSAFIHIRRLEMYSQASTQTLRCALCPVVWWPCCHSILVLSHRLHILKLQLMEMSSFDTQPVRHRPGNLAACLSCFFLSLSSPLFCGLYS